MMIVNNLPCFVGLGKSFKDTEFAYKKLSEAIVGL